LFTSVYNKTVLEGWKSLAKFFKTEKIINLQKKGLEKAGFSDDVNGNKNVFNYILAVANKNVSKIKQGEWFVTTIKGPKGKATIMTQWQKLDNGKIYLKTIKIF